MILPRDEHMAIVDIREKPDARFGSLTLIRCRGASRKTKVRLSRLDGFGNGGTSPCDEFDSCLRVFCKKRSRKAAEEILKSGAVG